MGAPNGLGIDLQQLCNFGHIPLLVIQELQDDSLPRGKQPVGDPELFDMAVFDGQSRFRNVVDRRRDLAPTSDEVDRG